MTAKRNPPSPLGFMIFTSPFHPGEIDHLRMLAREKKKDTEEEEICNQALGALTQQLPQITSEVNRLQERFMIKTHSFEQTVQEV